MLRLRHRPAAKGICCVEGNAGAPLEADEVEILEREYPNYRPYMTPEGIEAVERQGFMVVDEEGDLTTPLVGDAECAYTYTENGVTLCAIEKAWLRGQDTVPQAHLVPSLSDPPDALLRTVRRGSTTTAGRYAPRHAPSGPNWAFRSTRPCASRSSAASARSSTRPSKPPKRC